MSDIMKDLISVFILLIAMLSYRYFIGISATVLTSFIKKRYLDDLLDEESPCNEILDTEQKGE